MIKKAHAVFKADAKVIVQNQGAVVAGCKRSAVPHLC
jgi:hypothetical protein